MVRKSLNVLKGIKAKTILYERQRNPHKSPQTEANMEKINKCLNCTRPAKECKGDCYDW